MDRKWFIGLTVSAVVGVVLVAAGFGLTPLINSKIREAISENVKLVNNTEAYEAWMSPPADIFIEFYFFDVVNPDAIVHNKSKPIVRERGPYVYKEIRNKVDVKFLAGGTRLRYKEAKYYVFDRTRSVGDEEDNITNVNLAMLAIATKLEDSSLLIRSVVRAFVNNAGETLFQQHTVGEMLWGYRPSIVDRINKILARIPFVSYQINVTAGLFTGNQANGSTNGELDISTGEGDINSLGVVNSWNATKKLSWWSTPQANMINGTDGSMWHPFIEKTDKLYIFNTEICRSVYIQYLSETTISPSNIPVYTFVGPSSVFDNQHPDNVGFCYPNASFCLKAGVFDVSACREGAPVVMSGPHFFEADASYQTAIAGLDPTNEKYKTFINIEPNTGLVLDAAKKLQVNLRIRRLDTFPATMNLAEEEYIFPMVWVHEHGSISDEQAAEFRAKLLNPMLITKYIEYGLIGLGLLIISAVTLIVVINGVFAIIRTSRRKSEKSNISFSDVVTIDTTDTLLYLPDQSSLKSTKSCSSNESSSTDDSPLASSRPLISSSHS